MAYDSGSEYPSLNAPAPQTPARGPSNSYIFLTVLLVALAFTTGWLGNSFLNGVPSSARPYAGDIWKAWNDIDQYYVDKGAINHQQMAYAMLNAMVNTLGDTGHSRFLTPAQVAQLNQELNNTGIVGIGVYIHESPLPDNKTATIIAATIPNSPAQKAGLLPGDQIVTVDGQDITTKTGDQITALITGTVGTIVTITVQRQGTTAPISFSIKRDKVTPPIVNYYYFATSHIGFVQIDGFDDGATQQLTSALKTLQGQGMKGIILDLRDNGGGLVNEALGVAGNFLPNGATVVYEKDSSGISPDKVNDSTAPGGGPGLHLTLPMVVLVNGGTASASEIVTGALQDNRNIPVIGEQTFGTDTVLNTFPLSDGSELLLGTQQFLTPNKRQFKPGMGLEPSQPVTLPDKAFPLTPLALKEANLTEADVLSNNTKLSNDTQLIAAIKALQPQTGS